MSGNDFITTKGIILKTSNYGEYDRRLVVLTNDYGKITVFARGVRKQGSRYLAAASPFTYGELKAFPGKDAYSFIEFNAECYFDNIRKDYEGSCYGMYFLEVTDYYSRENNDDRELMKLLYVTLKKLEKLVLTPGLNGFDYETIRIFFELRAIKENGEFPGYPQKVFLSGETKQTIGHIIQSPFQKLYSVIISENTDKELKAIIKSYRDYFLKWNFNSLKLL